MKKKLFFYLFLIISIKNTFLMASNPRDTKYTLNKGELVFENNNSQLFIHILSYLKSLIENTQTPRSMTKKNLSFESTPQEHKNTTNSIKKFSKFVKNVYTTDACLYYIDRGAVQEAKKNDHTKLFNLIKKKSSDLKNTIYQKIFLDKDGIYKTLANSITIILQNIMINNDLLSIPYGQVGVLPTLKQIIDLKINALKQDNANLLLNEQKELKEREASVNAEKNSIELKIKELSDSTTLQVKRGQNNIAELNEKLDEATSIYANTQGNINELTKKITNLNTDILNQKNSLENYDNLILIDKKKNILENAKKLFEEVKPLAKDYYTNYAKWEESTKGKGIKGIFEQISSFVKDKPKELQDKAITFSEKIKAALNNFRESMKINNFPITETKGGFLLLQGIADQKDMLSQEKFDEIVNNISNDLKNYAQLLNEKNFYTKKTLIDQEESKLNDLSSLLNEKKKTLNDTQEKVDSLNKNINDLETRIARIKNHYNTHNAEYLQKIKNLGTLLEVDKQNIQIKHAATSNEYQQKIQNIHTTLDYANIGKDYIDSLKKLPFFGFAKEINNCMALVEIFNLLPQLQNEVKLQALEKKSKKEDSLKQQAIAFKQTAIENMSNLYARLKKEFSTNSSNNAESIEISNKDIYYVIENSLKEIIKANIEHLEKEIIKAHEKLLSLINAPSDDSEIKSLSYLQLFYLLYAKPIYILFEKLLTSIQHVTGMPINTSVKNNFALFTQQIDEVTKQIVTQQSINQISDQQSINTAYAFFKQVAQSLEQETAAIATINKNIEIDKNYFDFVNKINSLSALITIIEQSQLIWYENAKDLQNLFEPVKKAILDKKNSFLNDILNATEHIQSKKATTTSKDLELKNKELTGTLLEEIKRTYQLLEKITQITLVTTPQERTALFKSNHSSQWMTQLDDLIKTIVQDQEKLHQSETLYKQTVLFLYEKIKNTAEKVNIIKKTKIIPIKKTA